MDIQALYKMIAGPGLALMVTAWVMAAPGAVAQCCLKPTLAEDEDDNLLSAGPAAGKQDSERSVEQGEVHCGLPIPPLDLPALRAVGKIIFFQFFFFKCENEKVE